MAVWDESLGFSLLVLFGFLLLLGEIHVSNTKASDRHDSVLKNMLLKTDMPMYKQRMCYAKALDRQDSVLKKEVLHVSFAYYVFEV
jgi:hypothetical protein